MNGSGSVSPSGAIPPSQPEDTNGSEFQSPVTGNSTEGLRGGRLTGKRVSELPAAKVENIHPTEGLKKAPSREQLIEQRQKVIDEVNQLAIASDNLQTLNQAKAALDNSDKIPEGIVIKVMIGDEWVAIIPPDEKGLEGQNRQQLLDIVKVSVADSQAECMELAGPEQQEKSIPLLRNQLTAISQALGGEDAKQKFISSLWTKAIQELPKKIVTRGVLIEKVESPITPAPQPETDEEPKNDKGKSSSPQEPDISVEE